MLDRTQADSQGSTPPPDELAFAWRGLASPWRRRILDILSEQPLATGELANHFPELSRFAVMQHLRVLEQGDLVIRRKVGRKSMNHMNPVPIQQIYSRWVRRFQEPWTEALVSLKTKLESESETG